MNKLHRSISLILCFVFILSFTLSPIRAHAYFDPAYSTAYIVVGDVVVEGIKEGSKLIASAILSVWNTVVTEDFLKTCQGVLEIGSFFTSSSSYKGIYDSYSEGELSAGQTVLTKAFLSSVAAAYKTKTGITLTVPNEDVSIYVPPESVWEEAELITSDRLNYRGFADITEVNKNVLAGNQITWQLKQDFSSLALYLRTDLVDFLRDEYSSLQSGLTSSITLLNQTLSNKLSLVNSSLGDVETSVDVMSSTLSKHLSDLKSLYSQFGNSTLSKLDALNTSIQAINGYDMSTDFKHLKELETQFGNATLDSLDELISSTDYVLAAIFSEADGLSTQLSNIYEVLTDGFSDLSSKLDGLTVDVTFPYVDDIFNGVFGIESLNLEIRDLVSDGFSDLSNYLYEIECLNIEIRDYLDFLWSDDFLNALSDVSLSAESLAALHEVTNYFYEDYLRISELTQSLVDEIYVMLQTPLVSMTKNLTNVSASLDSLVTQLQSLETKLDENVTAFLQTDIVEILNDIKTSIKSIAGTTTADPGIGDDDSEDEANKQKIPLIPHINNGFEQGENYIGNVYTFLEDELAGFRVAALIFEEFAGISFFYKLIITSCSVGLIATLLGMALYAQSFNLYNRRREEAAQARARDRMAVRRVDLYVHA